MINNFIKYLFILGVNFFTLCLVLAFIERKFSLHKQKTFRKSWLTDAIYFFVGHFVGKFTNIVIFAVLTQAFIRQILNHTLTETIASQPIWLQFIEAIFIAEIGYYIAHRLTHEIAWLWQFHSIHHSVQDMDWLAAIRVHPVDQIFTKVFQLVPLCFLGFSEKILTMFFIFGAFEAFFIHANLRFKLGFLKWIIVTPEFHHWHHSADAKVYNKNFSAQLPIVDLLFGTFYIRNDKTPQKYGISDPIPSDYLGQIIYPFISNIKLIFLNPKISRK